MRRHVSLGLAVAALAAVPAGAQQPITFSQYASPTTTEYPAAVGAPLYAGGFAFYETTLWNGGSSRNALGTWGNDPSDPGYVNRPTNIGASTAMFSTVLGLEIDMYAAGSDIVNGIFGTPFTLRSMDIGHLYSDQYAPFTLGTINLTFRGFGPGTGGSTITQSFSIAPPPVSTSGYRYPVLTTITFDERWQGLDNVWWFQGTGSGTSHQFTNVVASVPEPGTWLLLATGLGVMALVARRRRA